MIEIVQTTEDCVFESLLSNEADGVGRKEGIHRTAHLSQVSVDRETKAKTGKTF